MYPYPTTCGEEAAILFKMLTGAQTPDLAIGLQAGWVVQGWGQSQFLPPPTEDQVKALDTRELTDDEAVSVLRSLGQVPGVVGDSHDMCVAALGEEVAGKGVAGDLALKFLVPLLLKWIQGGGLQRLLEKLLGASS